MIKLTNETKETLNRIALSAIANEEKAFRVYTKGPDENKEIADIIYADSEEDARQQMSKILPGYEITRVEEVKEDHETVTMKYFSKSKFSDGPDSFGEVTFYPTMFGYDYKTGDSDLDNAKNKPQWSTLRTIEAIKIWFRNVLFKYGAEDVYIDDEHWNLNELKNSTEAVKNADSANKIYDGIVYQFDGQDKLKVLSFKDDKYDVVYDDGTKAQLTKEDIDRFIVGSDDALESAPTKDQKHAYMLLDRLKQDCIDYIQQNGNAKLWAGDVDGQIAKMTELYEDLSEKPEWLTLEEIEEFSEKMHLIENGVLNENVNSDDVKIDTALTGVFADIDEWAYKFCDITLLLQYDQTETLDSVPEQVIQRFIDRNQDKYQYVNMPDGEVFYAPANVDVQAEFKKYMHNEFGE